MKSRFTALSLAGSLLLSLCACGAPAEPSAAPTLSAQPSLEAEALPSAPPSQDAEDVLAPASGAPMESGAPSLAPAAPEASQTPGEQPGETNLGAMPGGIVSSPIPSEAPSEQEELTAAGLRDSFMVTSSQSDAPTSGFADMSEYLSDFYNLDAADLEDFVFYMPEMSADLQEFFLAKAKPGKVEDVKAACQSRLDGLKEDAQFYPGTAEFVDAAKVETVGDWVVLAVCPEGSRMAKILQDRVK